MEKTFINATGDPVVKYCEKHSLREPAFLQELRDVTLKSLENYVMLIDPLASQLLRILLKSIGGKKCIEVGVFTGYNSCSMALALPEDGKIIALDVSKEYIDVGKPLWVKGGVDHKIDVRIGPATDGLDALIADGQQSTFDMVLVDADKANYRNYYERGLVLLREGGLMVIDNVLWDNKVVEDESLHDKTTQVLHSLNKFIKDDARVEVCMLRIGDGLTICRKL